MLRTAAVGEVAGSMATLCLLFVGLLLAFGCTEVILMYPLDRSIPRLPAFPNYVYFGYLPTFPRERMSSRGSLILVVVVLVAAAKWTGET